jgi:hypothetical protein
MIPKITQAKLDDIANHYAEKLLADVKQVFSTPDYKNTSELFDSLKVTVTKATDTEAPVIVLTYADQGFFLGYKNPQWTKLPNIEKFLKWGNRRDLDMNNIPGYAYGSAPNLSEEQKVSRIVWAIAKNKRKEDTWKQKKWKNKAKLGDLLKLLNKDTLTSFAKDVEAILVKSIVTGTVLS